MCRHRGFLRLRENKMMYNEYTKYSCIEEHIAACYDEEFALAAQRTKARRPSPDVVKQQIKTGIEALFATFAKELEQQYSLA